MKRFAKSILRRLGYEVHAYNLQRNHHLRKMRLLTDLGINLVIDAGANVGQFAEGLRALGYKGRIVSLEPIPALYQRLKAKADRAEGWEALNVAVGEREGEAELNVGDNTESSSFLPVTGASLSGAWTVAARQTVRVRTLDSLVPEVKRPGDRVYLKMDVQGYERFALAGGEQTLKETPALELEVSTIPLYKGEWLPEMAHHLAGKGFGVFSIDTLLVDYRNGRVLGYEVLFVRDHPPALAAYTTPQ